MIRRHAMTFCRAMLLGPLLACGCSLVSVQVMDDSNGQPLADAQVSYKAAGSDQAKQLGKTDHSGGLLFTAPKDISTLEVFKAGYRTYSSDFGTLRSGNDSLGVIDIRLSPLSEDPSQELFK